MTTQQQTDRASSQLMVAGAVTAVSALLFVAGLMLLVGELKITQFAGSGGLLTALLPLVVSASGVCLLSWFNSHSIKKSLFTAAIVLLLGVPLGFGVLLPVWQWVLALLLPGTSISSSTSFSTVWFIIIAPTIIEIITGPVIPRRRWARLIAGASLSFVLILFVELATERMGQSSEIDRYRMLFYAPVTWLLITFLVNPSEVSRYEEKSA